MSSLALVEHGLAGDLLLERARPEPDLEHDVARDRIDLLRRSSRCHAAASARPWANETHSGLKKRAIAAPR